MEKLSEDTWANNETEEKHWFNFANTIIIDRINKKDKDYIMQKKYWRKD